MRKIVEIFIKFLSGVIGIVLVSAAPALFGGSVFFDFRSYLAALKNVSTSFLTPSQWTLNYTEPMTFEIISISFADFLSGPYLYSMPILFLALGLAGIVAFLLALLALVANGTVKRLFLQVAKFLQSFPDFAFVFLVQLVVLAIFDWTGILLLSFYSLGDEQIYLAPILCLAILPTLLFFKLFILLFEEELECPYVELARSKGLGRFEVLWKHCTPNVLRSTFYQSKSIVWLTLSSLLIVEYLFGINGILYHLQSDFSPKGIAFILLTIFIPFFLLYTVIELSLGKKEIKRNAVMQKFNLKLFDAQESRARFTQLSRKRLRKAGFFPRIKRLPQLLIPMCVVLGLLIISVLYALITGDQVDQVHYIYDKEGGIESSSPHPPSAEIVLGTDPYGYSIAQQLLVGIKYTIALSVLVATLRVGLGYVLGIFHTFVLSTKVRNIANSIADGMHFLPLTLLALVLLMPVLVSTGEWNSTLTERLIYQVLIMSIIVLPITSSAIGNEMSEALKKDYVAGSVLMGASLSWILTKHIQPQLWPKLLLMWVQHIVQVLQMFVHLGILSVFVGGALYQSDSPRLVLEIYELSGMIAISREVFVTNQYWMILPPLAIFMLLSYSFTTIAEHLAYKKAIPRTGARASIQQKKDTSLDSFARIRKSQLNEEAN